LERMGGDAYSGVFFYFFLCFFFFFFFFFPLSSSYMLSCVSPTSSYELPFILPVWCRNNIVALTICVFGLYFDFSPSICFPVF
jgi:hypothetical protein